MAEPKAYRNIKSLKDIIDGIYNDISRAIIIATFAHNGQYDKGGSEYILHPIHIATQMNNSREFTVAILHDVVEDSLFSLDDIRNFGFPEPIINAIDALTRREGEEYSDYIERIKENDLATNVKLEDLRHNMDILRLPHLTKDDFKRLKKYQEAYATLFITRYY